MTQAVGLLGHISGKVDPLYASGSPQTRIVFTSVRLVPPPEEPNRERRSLPNRTVLTCPCSTSRAAPAPKYNGRPVEQMEGGEVGGEDAGGRRNPQSDSPNRWRRPSLRQRRCRAPPRLRRSTPERGQSTLAVCVGGQFFLRRVASFGPLGRCGHPCFSAAERRRAERAFARAAGKKWRFWRGANSKKGANMALQVQHCANTHRPTDRHPRTE